MTVKPRITFIAQSFFSGHTKLALRAALYICFIERRSRIFLVKPQDDVLCEVGTVEAGYRQRKLIAKYEIRLRGRFNKATSLVLNKSQ